MYLFIYLYVCVSNNSKSTDPNFVKFGGMMGNDLRMNPIGFGSDWVMVKVNSRSRKMVSGGILWR